LSGHKNVNYGYDCSYWEGIRATKTSYAISYGQILRELSHDEYFTLTNKYLDKLCELDLNFIESKI
jgi:hypothetical protein